MKELNNIMLFWLGIIRILRATLHRVEALITDHFRDFTSNLEEYMAAQLSIVYKDMNKETIIFLGNFTA